MNLVSIKSSPQIKHLHASLGPPVHSHLVGDNCSGDSGAIVSSPAHQHHPQLGHRSFSAKGELSGSRCHLERQKANILFRFLEYILGPVEDKLTSFIGSAGVEHTDGLVILEENLQNYQKKGNIEILKYI